MVTGNNTTEIGDVIVIHTTTPLVGLVAISGFIDSILGLSGTRFFTKQFRYSVDGINWSLYQDLTSANLQAIVVAPAYPFKIDYRYTRAGTDTTGNLELQSVSLLDIIVPPSASIAYDSSLFAQYFSYYSVDVLNWCLNVLEKLYKKGIIPKFIERGGNENFNWEDQDFIDFWRSICTYFALVVNYGRQFQDFPDYHDFLVKYIESKGLHVSETETDEDLLYLMEYFWDETRKRGTLKIAEQYQVVDIDQSSSSSGTPVTNLLNGELLRLITKGELDEFIFCYVESWKVGWNISNSSPLYRGINFYYNAIKGWERSQDVLNLSNYPVIDLAAVSVATDSGKQVIKITDPVVQAGIGSITWDSTKAILIDETLSYEVTFMMKLDRDLAHPAKLKFGSLGFDETGNFSSHENIVTGVVETTFFKNQQFNRVDKYYFVRGIIYKMNHPLLSVAQATLNIGFGEQLRFGKVTKYIIPFVGLAHSGFFQEAYLWDFKVRPLATDGEMCFIGNKNFLWTWMKNNTKKYTEDQIENIMRTQLLPYNLPFRNKYL